MTSIGGFALLRVAPEIRYRGVDRDPFEPTLREDELSGTGTGQRVSDFIREGWRRDLYVLAESGSTLDHPYLFSSRELALKLHAELQAHGEQYEVVHVDVGDPTSVSLSGVGPLLGYDAAYCGGDFYSAVKNGLFVNPSAELIARFAPFVNEHGLFTQVPALVEYVEAFRREAPSERDSTFCIYALSE